MRAKIDKALDESANAGNWLGLFLHGKGKGFFIILWGVIIIVGGGILYFICAMCHGLKGKSIKKF